MFNWKDIRQISKSQKVKSPTVYFSTFRLRNSEWRRSTFRLFNFSKLTMKLFHFSPFYFSNFPVTCSTFSFSSQTVVCLYNVRTLAPRKTCPAKKQKLKSEKMFPRKHMLCLNWEYIQIQHACLIILYLTIYILYIYISTTVAGSFDRWRFAMEKYNYIYICIYGVLRIHVCVHIYIHIYAYIYMFIRIYTYIYIHMYIYIYVCVCAYAESFKDKFVCIYIYLNTFIQYTLTNIGIHISYVLSMCTHT